MPRQARLDAPGVVHHLICRGIERRPLFRDEADRAAFVSRLGTVLTATATPCLAWALLPNHIHLLLRTGAVPLATVMRRLLTGYATTFNRRHRRHGYLFQNRYKSILVEEAPYLLELVRYIHLNPLRAGVVPTLAALARYPYAGHRVLLGRGAAAWQEVGSVLARFGARPAVARRGYAAFVAEGVAHGRRPELTGGGLVRSAGGWKAVRALRRTRQPVHADERILGDSAFVEAVLRAAEESLDRRTAWQRQGVTLETLVGWVAGQVGLPPAAIRQPGKHPQRVRARSLVCHWAVRELGVPGTTVGRLLGCTQSAVSRAAARGAAIVAADEKLAIPPKAKKA